MVDRQKLIIDTNVFMENLEKAKGLMNDYQIYIPYVILQELDNLKMSDNNTKSYKARNAARFINENKDNFNFIETTRNKDTINDDLIIETAKLNKCSLATNDIYMKIKATAMGIDLIEIDKTKEEYKGYKIVEMSDEEMADFYTNMNNNWNILTNEYLLIQNKEGDIIDEYRWNGNRFKVVKFKPINNKFMGKVRPRNIQQELLFDMLQCQDSRIFLSTGKMGTGKDMIMLSHALQQIENGKYNKLIWLRNNIEVADTRQIGFLPGTKEEKILPFAQIIADHVGGQFGLEMMVRDGKIELQHMGFIRGRDIKNSIVYISEAENMTKELVQLVIGRIGEGSVLYINGDCKQVDKDVFRINSGIKTMIDKLKGHEYFSYVKLEECERSEVARMVDLLD